MANQDETITYTLDANNQIIKVSGPWDAFALENQGERAMVDAVLGKTLDSFIAGDVTKMFVNTMLMSARTLGRTVYRPYRCDSERTKRFMEMSIIPKEDGTVEVRHRTILEEPMREIRPPTSVRRPPLGVPRIKRCSMCNKIHVAFSWLEIADAINLQVLAAEQADGPWIYGLCPECMDRRGVVL